MFRHILVPTDGTELSQGAAQVAVRLAKTVGAKITALHVIAPYSLPVSDGVWIYDAAFTADEYKEGSEKFAAEALAKVQDEAKRAGVECTPVFLTAAAPWDAIIRQARSGGCDLIVMASHGRKGLAGVILGSETTKVLTHSTIPVLVCR